MALYEQTRKCSSCSSLKTLVKFDGEQPLAFPILVLMMFGAAGKATCIHCLSKKRSKKMEKRRELTAVAMASTTEGPRAWYAPRVRRYRTTPRGATRWEFSSPLKTHRYRLSPHRRLSPNLRARNRHRKTSTQNRLQRMWYGQSCSTG